VRGTIGRPFGRPLFGALLGGGDLFTGGCELGGGISTCLFELAAQLLQRPFVRGTFGRPFPLLLRRLRLQGAGVFACSGGRLRGLLGL
jgi:hypothetical protein